MFALPERPPRSGPRGAGQDLRLSSQALIPLPNEKQAARLDYQRVTNSATTSATMNAARAILQRSRPFHSSGCHFERSLGVRFGLPNLSSSAWTLTLAEVVLAVVQKPEREDRREPATARPPA
jgi:hypothetical protein